MLFVWQNDALLSNCQFISQMLNYTVKFEGYEEDEKNIYFKVRITDMMQMEVREIKIRYSTLNDLNNQLISDNPYHDFPPFPKKDSWKSMLKVLRSDNQEQIKQREAAFNTYFYQLLKFPPARIEALAKFLRDGVDAIRQQSIQSLMNVFSSKQDFFKQYSKIKRIENTFFKRIYLTTYNNQNYFLNEFRLPNTENLGRQLQLYQDLSAKFVDFTYLNKVISIFQMRKDRGIMRMIWGSKPKPKVKPNLYAKLAYMVDEAQPYEFIYSIEEDTGSSLQTEFEKKSKNQFHFQFDEILLIMQSFVSGANQLHKLGIAHKNIQLKNALLQANGNVKLTSVCDPIIDLRERYLLTQNGQFDQLIYIPPETVCNNIFDKLAGFQNSYNYNYSYYGTTSYSNVYKQDSWAIGICLLQLCTLMPVSEMSDIHQKNSISLSNMIKTAVEIYGGGIGSIISLMTAQNPKDRSDMGELMLQVFQTHLIPMRLELFQSNKAQRIIKYRLNNLDDASMKKLNVQIKENQKYPNVLYDFTITLESEDNLEENAAILLDQLRIISLRTIHLNLLCSEAKSLPVDFIALLLQTTKTPKLRLNFQKSQAQIDQLMNIVRTIIESQVTDVILDLTGCQGLDLESASQIEQMLTSQGNLQSKIYWVVETDLENSKIVTEI